VVFVESADINRMTRRRRNVSCELKTALQDALQYERGYQIDLRVTAIPPLAKSMPPSRIKKIRVSLRASQPQFARLLNVSTNTVQSWEQGVRRPRQAALKLLMIADRNPQALLDEPSTSQARGAAAVAR
jgi:putative transcriptional regulator